jgi:hypothetical protein
MYFFYLIPWLWAGRGEKGLALKGFLGAVLAVAVYLGLHFRDLRDILVQLRAGNSSGEEPSPHFLYSYFFQTKFLRHIPELVAWLAAIGVAVRRGLFGKEPLLTGLLISALAFTVVIRRPNFQYVIHLYPVFLLWMVRVAEEWRAAVAVPAAFAIFLLPQYSWIAWQTRNMGFEGYRARLAATVPADGLPVFGAPNDWFAFQERPYYVLHFGPAARPDLSRGFYVIRTTTNPHSLAPPLAEGMAATEPRLLAEFAMNGGTTRVEYFSK